MSTQTTLRAWRSSCSIGSLSATKCRLSRTIHSAGEEDDCPAMWSDPAVCRVLIDAGADLHTKNEIERLPLHTACVSGALDVVKMLVEAGAEVRDTDGEECTCLIIAAEYGHTEIVRYLVGLPEVDVNHATYDALTALYKAVDEERTEVVQVLIDAGAYLGANRTR